MDLDSRRQIKRQCEAQKGARRLRCLEYLGRTQWKSYGKISGRRNKRKPLQTEPLAEDLTRLKLKQTLTTENELPPIHESGSYFLGGDANVSLSTRGPVAPVRAKSATVEPFEEIWRPAAGT